MANVLTVRAVRRRADETRNADERRGQRNAACAVQAVCVQCGIGEMRDHAPMIPPTTGRR